MSQVIKAKTYHALTEDGWKIALHRYPRKTRRRSPVLLVHGLASNRNNMDFPNEKYSLAKYLWKEGWDSWVIELRGTGKSTKPRGLKWLIKSWNMDHHILYDLPAAIRLIQEETSHPQVHWLGHSLGGMLVSPFVRIHSPSAIRSVTAACAPMVTGNGHSHLSWIYFFDPIFWILPYAPYRVIANLLHLGSKWIHGQAEKGFFVRENMELQTLRTAISAGLEDLSSSAFRQFFQWMADKKFKSPDSGIIFHTNYKKMNFPFLILTGSHDPYTPTPEIQYFFDKIRSKKKKWIVFGKEFGHAANYGHLDLILGRHAPREVYPIISNWLEENN